MFEAQNRLGGRIQTSKFDTDSIPYDAGAAEFYTYTHSKELEDFVDKLGLKKVWMSGFPIMVQNKTDIIYNDKDFPKFYGDKTIDKIKSFMKLGKKFRPPKEYATGGLENDNEHPWIDRSFDDILSDMGDEKAKDFLKIKSHCDIAAECPDINGIFGFDNLLIDEPDYCKLYALSGGNENLIKRLYQKLGCRIYLNSPVYSINKKNSKYVLSVKLDKKRLIDFTFDIIILALAHYQIPKINIEDKELDAKLKKHYEHYDYDTHYLRVTILFKDTFWRDYFNESYFIDSSFGGVCVYDESARKDTGKYGVLSWLIGGQDAFDLNKLSDKAIISKVLDSLPKKIASGKDKFVEGKEVDRWIDGVSAQPGGKPVHNMKEKHVLAPNFFIVGDYLTDTTVNGSLHSAEYVSKQIAEKSS